MQDIFTRSKKNPILKPKGTSWWKIYNPGAILDEKGYFHLFPRVMKKQSDWHSQIGHAISKDGESFRWKGIILKRRKGHKDETKGVEDPRVSKVGDTYHIVFAAFNNHDVELHSATTKDLNKAWNRSDKKMVPNFYFHKSGGKKVSFVNGKIVTKKVLKKKDGLHWAKAGGLFPEKIDGKYHLLFGDFNIWHAVSRDGKTFKVDQKPFMKPRNKPNLFDNAFIEMGPAPIKTDKGWLVLYHGIDEAFRYQLGFVLLDLKNPKKILFRSNVPIFGPKENYEIGDALIDVVPGGIDAIKNLSDSELKKFYKKVRAKGGMPQVVFCPAAVLKDKILYLYYGAGDKSICMAHAPLEKILELT